MRRLVFFALRAGEVHVGELIHEELPVVRDALLDVFQAADLRQGALRFEIVLDRRRRLPDEIAEPEREAVAEESTDQAVLEVDVEVACLPELLAGPRLLELLLIGGELFRRSVLRDQRL